jgi:hypothetical protein
MLGVAPSVLSVEGWATPEASPCRAHRRGIGCGDRGEEQRETARLGRLDVFSASNRFLFYLPVVVEVILFNFKGNKKQKNQTMKLLLSLLLGIDDNRDQSPVPFPKKTKPQQNPSQESRKLLKTKTLSQMCHTRRNHLTGNYSKLNKFLSRSLK